MIGLPITGIAVAVAVTAGAAALMQVRSDIRDAGAFEVRERELVELARRNAEQAAEHSRLADREREGRARAEAAAQDAIENSEAAAAAVMEEAQAQCEDSCYLLRWED